MTIGKSCPKYHQYGQLYPDWMELQYAFCDYYAKIVQLSARIIEFSRRPWGMKLLYTMSSRFDSEFKSHCDRLAKAGDAFKYTLEVLIRRSIKRLEPENELTKTIIGTSSNKLTPLYIL